MKRITVELTEIELEAFRASAYEAKRSMNAHAGWIIVGHLADEGRFSKPKSSPNKPLDEIQQLEQTDR
jgi:hypothetical protein